MILPLVPCISDILYTCIATGKQLTSLCTARRCCRFAFPLPSSCTWEISAQHVLSTWLGQQPPRHSPLWPDMKTPFKRQSKRNLELNRKLFICEYEWIYRRIYVSMMYQCSAKNVSVFPSHKVTFTQWCFKWSTRKHLLTPHSWVQASLACRVHVTSGEIFAICSLPLQGKHLRIISLCMEKQELRSETLEDLSC